MAEGGASKTLLEIWASRRFQLAVAAAATGAGVVVALMTATPLAMSHAAHGFSSAHVVQWHIVAMYLPSFFTGRLIERFGYSQIIASGLVLDAIAIAVHSAATSVTAFWIGLFLIGLGWNFLFVGGTALVTDLTSPNDRARVQASNEFIIFTASALASLLAGVIFATSGWTVLNLWNCCRSHWSRSCCTARGMACADPR